jgi:hypothetical protein|tara:strand:- start:101 stop:523 length:423 start_codon:yes stop_codon:yes gene_type:complete
MSFVTTTLRDTVVNAPKAGGMVTVKATFASDTATNLILDGDGLDGFANGAKLDLLRAWWSFSTGNYDTDNSNDCIIEFKGSSNDVVALHLSGTGHYDGSAGAIPGSATNTTVTSSDITAQTKTTSGFVILEFRKDEAYTA